MNGNKYLADTNAYIYLLQKHPALRNLLQAEWLYSFISEIELLGKPGIKPEEERLVKAMLSFSTKIRYSEEISEQTIRLKQQYNIKTPDAIIAASALHLNVPLLTADKGYVRIKALDIVLIDS